MLSFLTFLTVCKCCNFCVIIFPCTAWLLSFMLSFNVIIFCYHFPPFFFFPKTCHTRIFAGFSLNTINFAVYLCTSAQCVFRLRRFLLKQLSDLYFLCTRSVGKAKQKNVSFFLSSVMNEKFLSNTLLHIAINTVLLSLLYFFSEIQI